MKFLEHIAEQIKNKHQNIEGPLLEDAISFLRVLSASNPSDRIDDRYVEYEEKLEEILDEDFD